MHDTDILDGIYDLSLHSIMMKIYLYEGVDKQIIASTLIVILFKIFDPPWHPTQSWIHPKAMALA